MENQIGSRPRAATTGMKIGIVSSMIEMVSMKQPSTSTSACMITTVRSGGRSSPETVSTRPEVAPVAAAISANS